MVREIAFVGLGAGSGGVLRYLLNLAIQSEKYPVATTLINLSGSFALGVVAVFWAKDHPMRLLLGVGFLGGYTTFSTFSLEVAEQLKKGDIAAACVNIILQTLGSVTFCIAGMWLANKLKQ
jgi:fluoride exporter